ncbi:NlpC/P60 family protein [Methylobacterium sp. WL6]|uniref:C40 family peptidase n=1 Tax=Methylobacterium sp. WL6 TaxID=2603901 RepID=UPI0011CC8EDA|nr:NlpC/P60 family protein [Methylobacterium sp. WL6]TXN64986.1 NlpC/P60 family protein [Methylobacterium sp. WL6]
MLAFKPASTDVHGAATGAWSNAYVGLPWRERGLTRDGIACWGLARLIYAEMLGIPVPDYCAEVASIQERAEVAAVFARSTAVGPWVAVAEAQPFDIAVFRRAGIAAHVGIVVMEGRMLHITAGRESAIVDFTTGCWSPRFSGFYRHRATMEATHVG